MSLSLTASLDARRSFMLKIREADKDFYDEFVLSFLTDKQTLVGVEKDFVKAMVTIKGVSVLLKKDMTVIVDDAEFESFEDAFIYLFELLEPSGPELKVYKTVIKYVDEAGATSEAEGKPIIASSYREAKETCRKYMPYLTVLPEGSHMSGSKLFDLAKKIIDA